MTATEKNEIKAVVKEALIELFYQSSISITEASRILKVSRQTIYRMIADGRLTGTEKGKIKQDDLFKTIIQ